MADQLSLVAVLERFASTMGTTFATGDVLHELSDSTVEVLGAAGAGVCVVNKQHQLMFATATSRDVVVIERRQEQDQQGPCVEAFTTGETVAVSQINALDRWPAYQQVAKEIGFHAVLGIPLLRGYSREHQIAVRKVAHAVINRVLRIPACKT